MNEQSLICEIEQAFGREPCPRGLRITIDSDIGDYPEVRAHFHHRNWWDCDADFWIRQQGAFTFMTDEARVYFSPSHMIASLREPNRGNDGPENFVWNLSETLLAKYTVPQLQSIAHYIEHHLPEEPWRSKDLRTKLELVRRMIEKG